MEPRRITGPDIKTALRMVREQLGADAMILSNRRTSEGIEITAIPEGSVAQVHAAVEEFVRKPAVTAVPRAPADGERLQDLAQQIEARTQGYLAVSKPRPVPTTAPAPQIPSYVAEASGLETMQSELRSMRSFLETGLTEMRVDRASNGRGVAGQVWRRLTRVGIPNDLVRQLVAAIDPGMELSEAWDAVLAKLGAGLHEAGDVVAEGGVFAFAGPTGVGKTTTLCKLAVRHALEHGVEGLALISMDNVRIGGCEMLRSVARLLGVPCHAVGEGDTLQDVLDRLGDKHLVLIDTAGINRKFQQHMEQLEVLGGLRDRVRSFLVLPANAQLSSLQAAVADYAGVDPVACIVTKLDETQSLGEIVGVLSSRCLAIAYSSDGQEIPEDLRVATVTELVAATLRHDADQPAVTPAAMTGKGFADATRPGNTARIA